MPRLLIHIGLHKTGTTWLQRVLFDSEAAGFRQPFQRGEDVGVWLVAPHDLDFDPDAARSHFLGILRNHTADSVPVLSHERLSGHPHSGGYDAGPLAARLRTVFPEARILIAVREQTSAIVSSYQQYIRSGATGGILRYLEPPEMGRNRIPAFSLRHFEYDRLVRCYRNLFGPDRVLVLPYEQFLHDPESYVHRIVDFAGADPVAGAVAALPFRTVVNASESVLSLGVRRVANRAFGRSRMQPVPLIHLPAAHRWLHRRSSALDRVTPTRFHAALQRRLRSTAESFIGDHFLESNRRLAELVDFDLGPLGYRL